MIVRLAGFQFCVTMISINYFYIQIVNVPVLPFLRKGGNRGNIVDTLEYWPYEYHIQIKSLGRYK